MKCLSLIKIVFIMPESNSSSKRVLKNTLLLYLRMLVVMAVGLFTSRIVLNVLGVDDYGIYNVVGGIVVLLSFLNNAMAGATQRYLNVSLGQNNQLEMNKIVGNAFLLHFVVAVIVLIIAETFGLYFLNTKLVIPIGRETAANWVYQFSIFSFLAGVLAVPFSACIIAHEKMSAFAWISIIDVLTKLIVVTSLLLVDADKLILYAAILFFQSCFVQFAYALYCRSKFEECKIRSMRFDRPLLKSMASFSGWTILGNFGYLIHTQGIAIIINLFFGVAVNAAQGISNQVNGIVKQFVSNFLLAFNPQVVKTYAAGEIEEMHKLILRGSKIAMLMVAFFVIPLILETPVILKVWLGKVPDYTIIFVRLVLLLTFFDSFSNLLAAAKGATGDVKVYQIVLTLIGLTHLPIVWICYELGCDPYWAQLVYLFIILILQVVRIWFVCRAIGLSQKKFYGNVVAKCLLTVMLSCIFPLFLHQHLSPSLWHSAIICTLCATMMVAIAPFVSFNKSERRKIIELVKKKIKPGVIHEC